MQDTHGGITTSSGVSPSAHSPRGVVYISRIPTLMMPSEVRRAFETYGEIFRSRFVPTKKSALAHSGSGGNKANKNKTVQFAEAWIEFMRKQDAREAAQRLNASPVLVKHTRRCYGENWCVKYLPGFTWGDIITEREEQSRGHRLEEYEEKQKERKLNDEYRALVMASMKRKEQKQKHKQQQHQQHKTVATSEVGDGGKKEGDLPERRKHARANDDEEGPKQVAKEGKHVQTGKEGKVQNRVLGAKKKSNKVGTIEPRVGGASAEEGSPTRLRKKHRVDPTKKKSVPTAKLQP